MKTETQDVSMRVNGQTKVVGTATYAEYDSVSEAIDNVGEEKCLEFINAQVRTNAMNRKRGEVRNGPGKKALQAKALASITPEEWAQLAGNPDAIQTKIEAKMAELEAEVLETAGNEN